MNIVFDDEIKAHTFYMHASTDDKNIALIKSTESRWYLVDREGLSEFNLPVGAFRTPPESNLFVRIKSTTS